VDIFFDTTVLVAASEQSPPHYAQARPALVRFAAGQDKGFMGLHCTHASAGTAAHTSA
jgi:predicted nucleic acid-binding protein